MLSNRSFAGIIATRTEKKAESMLGNDARRRDATCQYIFDFFPFGKDNTYRKEERRGEKEIKEKGKKRKTIRLRFRGRKSRARERRKCLSHRRAVEGTFMEELRGHGGNPGRRARN